MNKNSTTPKTTAHGDLYQNFYHNLNRLRRAAKIKQNAAAIALGVSQATWSQWENGKRFPHGEMLLAIAHLFDTPPCTLLQNPQSPCHQSLQNLHKA